MEEARFTSDVEILAESIDNLSLVSEDDTGEPLPIP